MMTKLNGEVWLPPSRLFKIPPQFREQIEALLTKPMDAAAYEESEALGAEFKKLHPNAPGRAELAGDDALLIDRIIAAQEKYKADAANQKLYFDKLQAGMAMALEAAHFLGGHLQISYQPKRSVEPKEP